MLLFYRATIDAGMQSLAKHIPKGMTSLTPALDLVCKCVHSIYIYVCIYLHIFVNVVRWKNIVSKDLILLLHFYIRIITTYKV